MPLQTPISQLLSQIEWYDNTFLEIIDRCNRKAFWRGVFTLTTAEAARLAEQLGKPIVGIAEAVSPKADFGTCIHAALDKFYSPILYHSHTYQQRRYAAIRAFSSKYHALIDEDRLAPLYNAKAYTELRGIDLLDMYFDRYKEEDELYEPIETELFTLVKIDYRPTDPYFFTPFYWVARCDGVVRRVRFDDYYIMEHKTSSGPENKLAELVIGRQGRGYYYNLTQFPSKRPIVGLIGNILACRAAECDPTKLFFREYIPLSIQDAELWRLQTIHKVTRWREVRRLADSIQAGPAQLAAFTQTTAECTRYGKCTYYDLCLYGPEGVNLEKYLPNTWDPSHAEKMED